MFRTTDYRYPNEILILVGTILLVLLVIIITTTATFCLAGIFIIVMLGMALFANRSHHKTLMQKAYPVRSDNAPGLANVAIWSHKRLQPGPVELYLVKSKALNAYTFGLSDPKVIVLYEPLLQVMDADEMAFIIGHEMGHISLGHTWLNTLLGGMAGVPAPFGAAVILYTAFLSWNRACEYSADRAGLLACGSLSKAISSLVKLVAPNLRSQTDFDRALTKIDAQDDSVANQFGELFQSHPMVIRRINKLKEYASSTEYKLLQISMDNNLSS